MVKVVEHSGLIELQFAGVFFSKHLAGGLSLVKMGKKEEFDEDYSTAMEAGAMAGVQAIVVSSAAVYAG
jgi:hypothetical protein